MISLQPSAENCNRLPTADWYKDTLLPADSQVAFIVSAGDIHHLTSDLYDATIKASTGLA